MIPVPGYPIGTPYGRRGPHWGCHRNAQGGIHTGVDYPAPTGTIVVAARGGVVAYVNHGPAFGRHQLEIVAGDGTRDFYAHMTTRLVRNYAHVRAGQKIGRVGAEGNVTGPHLHMERHAIASGPWSCAIVRDPAPSINHRGKAVDMPLTESDLEKIAARVNRVLGDYDAKGKPRKGAARPRLANARISSLEQLVRKLDQRLAKLEKRK